MKFNVRNIFLDTNIFEENNFFHSTFIQSLFHYSKLQTINLYMSEISKMELIDRMKKRLSEIIVDHNKFVTTLNKKYRILKNLSQYKNIERLPIEMEKAMFELENKLNRVIKVSNIQIITSNVKIEEVFKHYYKKESPFSTNSKKHEFPDAFIIKSIDSWCKENNEKMIFVTKDNDFKYYKSDFIMFENELSELLETITIYYDSLQKTKIIPFIIQSLNYNEKHLLSLIENELDSMFKLNLDFETISNYSRSEASFKDYKIISIKQDYAEVVYNIEIQYSYLKIPSIVDLDHFFFEDDIEPKKITKKMVIPCDLEVSLTNKNIIKLKWINSNQKIIISEEI